MSAPASTAAAAAPSSLLLITTSQSALPVRYPHPHKPRLVIPPLVHRSLHLALDPPRSESGTATASSSSGSSSPSPLIRNFLLAPAESGSASGSGSTLIIPHPDTIIKHDLPARHPGPVPNGSAKSSIDTNTNVDNDPVSLVSDSELTVKLHLVGSGSVEERAGWVEEALSVLAQYKGLGASSSDPASATASIDTLLVGFKGVDYKGKRTAASEFFGCGAEGMDGGGGGGEEVSQEVEDEVAAIWDLVRASQAGKAGRLGTLYLPLGVLRRLALGPAAEAKGKRESEEQTGPKINMLDTPDCHHLPHDYADFAKEQGIELWAGGGGEGADPLPNADLHNLLHEFAPTLNLTDPIPNLIPLRPDELKYDLIGGGPSSTAAARTPGVGVRWVLGYTVLSRARNVVVDKGYIVSADLRA